MPCLLSDRAMALEVFESCESRLLIDCNPLPRAFAADVRASEKDPFTLASAAGVRASEDDSRDRLVL